MPKLQQVIHTGIYWAKNSPLYGQLIKQMSRWTTGVNKTPGFAGCLYPELDEGFNNIASTCNCGDFSNCQNFPYNSTIYGYKIDRASFEVSAPQKQENICNQGGKKLKGPCRWDDKCWDKRDQHRTNNPATNKYSKPGITHA